MNSDARMRTGPGRPSTTTGSRPAVMSMPDILVMTSNGQPGRGERITLPSGAVWEAGGAEGTSVITWPHDGPISADESTAAAANSIVGRPLRLDALANAIAGVFKNVPRLFREQLAADSDENGEARIVRFSARTTLRNPAKRRRSGAEALRGDDGDLPETGGDLPGIDPVRRASGGVVWGAGGPRDDAILARLSNGEYVVNAAATANNRALLDAINAGWVPSADFLATMLPGFASGGEVGGSGVDRWRDLLGGALASPVGTVDPTASKFGLTGLAADALGFIATAAIDAGGRAGSAVGSALAPAFGPGGVLSALFGSRGAAPGLDGGGADGGALNATLRVDPEGLPVGPGAGGILSNLFGANRSGAKPDGNALLGSLSEVLGTGLTDAAGEAGGRVGEALGSAIAPALGPAGALAPQIGAELGRLIGTQFGGTLSAAMTMSGPTATPGVVGPDGAVSTELGQSSPEQAANQLTAGTPGISVPGGSGGAGGTGAAQNGQQQTGTASDWWLVKSDGSAGVPLQSILTALEEQSPARDGSAAKQDPAKPGSGGQPTGNGGSPLKSLALQGTVLDGQSNDLTELGRLAGSVLGGDLGSALAPALGDAGGSASILGSQAGSTVGSWLGAAASALAPVLDPTGQWAQTLQAQFGGETVVDWNGGPDAGASNPAAPGQRPTDGKGPFGINNDDLALAAVSGAIQGSQGGLYGMAKGALTGVAATAGSAIGGAIGTAIAPGLGTAVGQALGSAAGQMGVQTVLEPIEKGFGYLADTAKEVVGTGFGLVDLANGPGGHTARQDIYNFNGMDPKSAAIAVERVRRRRTLAQQRGGGLGR
ncbi:hypothetical protein ACWEKT_03160 [Nocardia takedensis]